MALYDLAEDPFEMFDLRAEMPERVSELVKQHRASWHRLRTTR